MADHANQKTLKFTSLMDEITVLTGEMEAEDGKGDTPDNREKLSAKLTEAETLRKSIEQDNIILGLKAFKDEPLGSKVYAPAGNDGGSAQPFQGNKSIGEQLVESDMYKAALKDGFSKFGFDAKGFGGPSAFKTTFDGTSTGLDTSRNYITRPVELVQQQRMTIRDLLSVGQTTQNIIYFIKESSFTNAAGMVAEEGEKPEATLATTSSSVPVKKIAVVLKVTDEMWNDFPQLRDYVNTRLTFMVQAREEDQLLNGSGSGNNITGLLNVSGIQTQAKGGDTNLDAIHKAKTKVMTPTTGGYQPDGIVLNPTDWQILRLSKDANNQYFGGGPFVGEYGVGQYTLYPPVWGLTPVITTAITAGTALVGAFKYGAQIWQREGIRVEAFNQNEDDVNFNRITLRVEERLALAVYAPGAFCTVTGIT